MSQNNHGVSRRTVVKGAAWSLPVIAAGVALPMAAASVDGVNNGDANYYWSAEAQGGFTTLVAAAGGLKATFSTQISYRSQPDWVSPPAGATLMVTVQFTSPVTLDRGSWLGSWIPVPPAGSSATTFTFTLTPPNNGAALTFNVVGSAPGEITSTATMRLLDGGTTTWTPEASAQSAVLIA